MISARGPQTKFFEPLVMQVRLLATVRRREILKFCLLETRNHEIQALGSWAETRNPEIQAISSWAATRNPEIQICNRCMQSL